MRRSIFALVCAVIVGLAVIIPIGGLLGSLADVIGRSLVVTFISSILGLILPIFIGYLVYKRIVSGK